MESVFGVLASVLFYGEVVTGRMAAGFVLIFAAILLSELAPTRAKREKRPETNEPLGILGSRNVPIANEDDAEPVANP